MNYINLINADGTRAQILELIEINLPNRLINYFCRVDSNISTLPKLLDFIWILSFKLMPSFGGGLISSMLGKISRCEFASPILSVFLITL